MVHLGDLTRSLDPFATQSAATPASSSGSLPPAKPSAASVKSLDATLSTDDVSISAEAVRQLQRAAELEQQQAATLKAIGEDAELAARMAHEMAYRREVVVVPAKAYGDLATSRFASGSPSAINPASIAKAQSDLERSRLERIAIYEFETAKGTPPAEIYSRLLAIEAARPEGYSIALAT